MYGLGVLAPRISIWGIGTGASPREPREAMVSLLHNLSLSVTYPHGALVSLLLGLPVWEVGTGQNSELHAPLTP